MPCRAHVHHPNSKLAGIEAPTFGVNREAYLQLCLQRSPVAQRVFCCHGADLQEPCQTLVDPAQVVSEDAGLALDKLDLNALGRAKKVTISKDDTIVLDGAGEKARPKTLALPEGASNMIRLVYKQDSGAFTISPAFLTF